MVRLSERFRRVGEAPPDHADRFDAIERRLRHLETLLEGLQDSVHRESVRREKEIQELKKKTEPAQLSRALSQDARKRGI